MLNNFDELVKKSQNATKIDNILKSENNKKSFDDERFWKLQPGKDETGQALIRFLPRMSSDSVNDLPYVSRREYWIKEPGKSKPFVANSPYSLSGDNKDPIYEDTQKYWVSDSEDMKKIARRRSAKLHYYANILVLKDPNNPENEGKVFIFKFGKKIHEKIMNSMAEDEISGEPAIRPFDLMENGADFRLKLTKVSGFNNYDTSMFNSPKELSNEGKTALMNELKRIGQNGKYVGYDLDELVSPDKFDSYEKLKSRWESYLGLEVDIPQQPTYVNKELDEKAISDEFTKIKDVTNDDSGSELTDEELKRYFEELDLNDTE